MKTFKDWLTEHDEEFLDRGEPEDDGDERPEVDIDHDMPGVDEKNDSGGYEPHGEQQLRRYKHADLITLPPSVKGTNCGNCKFQKGGVCQHEDLRGEKVTERMCCKYWFAEGSIRSWEKPHK